MFTLLVRDSFSAAHRLENYKGKCEALHGHNYSVEALFRGEKLNAEGMLVDFKVLKGYVKTVLESLDHRYINEMPFFCTQASSSEYVAMYVFREIKRLIREEGLSLKEVRIWESENSCVAYEE
jgi:6-pyruvoyltetrahydropterin/6-carboxytetrahydropterin synthase